MKDIILKIAQEDERIRAVLLTGSRADQEVFPDKYQDYDIIYFVKSAKEFYHNTEWIRDSFGEPSIMQMPDIMPGADAASLKMPDYTRFAYLMIFANGERIDLTVRELPYEHDGEPAILLLDKDNKLANICPSPTHWHTKKPVSRQYDDCCNEFYWCLNNVAKGIARDELTYAMEMFNVCVRDMLNCMLSWYIGVDTAFTVSSGKCGKYFKKYLKAEDYQQVVSTYCAASYSELWDSVNCICVLFEKTAKHVASKLEFSFNQVQADAMLHYIDIVHMECVKNCKAAAQ